jgi:4-amino-4-deoxy-L-arabinose transferase-like glycosyltransferase
LLGPILPIALLLRLVHLQQKSFWHDEWYSIGVARLNWPTFVHLIANREANMVLYYALLRFWMRFGESEVFIMILSVLFGLAALPVVWAIGNRLFGGRVGLIAAFLLAVNAFHIKYSQEVRGYSLLVLLAALSVFFFVRGIEQPSRKTWIMYGLVTTLAIYTHLFGVFLLPSHWMSLPFLPREKVPWKGLVASSSAVVFFALPLGAFALALGGGPISWVQKPTVESVGVFFYTLAGGGGMPFLTLAYFIFCAGACLLFLRVWCSAGRSLQAWRFVAVLTSLLVPAALALAFSFIKPMFEARFLIICQPALVLLAAAGLSEIRCRWLLEASLAVVASLAAQAIIHYYRYPTRFEPGRGDWSGASHYVGRKAEASRDAMIFYPWNCRLPFDYFGRRSPVGAADPAIIYPADWVEAQLTRLGPNSIHVQELPNRYDRVWLVLCLGRVRDETPVAAPLAAAYGSVVEQNFQGVSISLYADPVRQSAVGRKDNHF